MGEKQWEADNVFDVIGDTLARKLLVILSEDRRDVDELSELLDASRPTIYRRLDTLADYDLIKIHQEVDADGHHYKTYETTLQRISFEIEDGATILTSRCVGVWSTSSRRSGQIWNRPPRPSHGRNSRTPTTRVERRTFSMSDPPELWTFIVANVIGSVLALLITTLSFLAYRANDHSPSFRSATIGFGFLTLGTLVEPMYQLVWRGDYNITGRELLGIQSAEAIFWGLGFAVLFYSIYIHSSTKTDRMYQTGRPEDGDVSCEDGVTSERY